MVRFFVKFPPHSVDMLSLYGENILIFDSVCRNIVDWVVTLLICREFVQIFQLAVSGDSIVSSHVVGLV